MRLVIILGPTVQGFSGERLDGEAGPVMGDAYRIDFSPIGEPGDPADDTTIVCKLSVLPDGRDNAAVPSVHRIHVVRDRPDMDVRPDDALAGGEDVVWEAMEWCRDDDTSPEAPITHLGPVEFSQAPDGMIH